MNMEKRTRGQIEAHISEAMIKFEKEYMGRGPMETKTHILRDMIVVRLKGVLTPAEEQLAKSVEGANLIKQTRVRLLESAKLLLEQMIADITGTSVVSLHSDISTRTGERIIIFVLEKDLDELFPQAG
ncbi:MAG: Na-translocating system protein MpsC family protein [Endomicrobiales bacterium]